MKWRAAGRVGRLETDREPLPRGARYFHGQNAIFEVPESDIIEDTARDAALSRHYRILCAVRMEITYSKSDMIQGER